jgi:DNA-binding transcriptional LysR family regulator
MSFVRLFTALPHVFVSKNSPLASRKSVTLEDLRPYPRLTYDQGMKNSFYFAEELHITAESPKNIVVSDRATLFNLLIGLNGYTISSGVLSSDLNGSNIVSIPLESDETMEIGYITSDEQPINQITHRYIEHLEGYISRYYNS